mgnify:CR=1 FL=1
MAHEIKFKKQGGGISVYLNGKCIAYGCTGQQARLVRARVDAGLVAAGQPESRTVKESYLTEQKVIFTANEKRLKELRENYYSIFFDLKKLYIYSEGIINGWYYVGIIDEEEQRSLLEKYAV